MTNTDKIETLVCSIIKMTPERPLPIYITGPVAVSAAPTTPYYLKVGRLQKGEVIYAMRQQRWR